MTATAVPAARADLVSPAWRKAISTGLIGSAVAVYLAVVGIIGTFDRQQLVAGLLTLGEAFLLLTVVATAYIAARRMAAARLRTLAAGTLAGLLVGLGLALLVVIGSVLNLRVMFRPVSTQLFDILTFDQFGELAAAGAVVPLIVGALLGLGAAVVAVLPRTIQQAFGLAIVSIMIFGVFAGIVRTPMLGSPLAGLARDLFASAGLQVFGAIVTLSGALGLGFGAAIGERVGGRLGGAVLGLLGGAALALAGGTLGEDAADSAELGAFVGGVLGIVAGGVAGGLIEKSLRRPSVGESLAALPQPAQDAGRGALLLLLLVLVAVMPHAAGPFFASVVALVALYILMGLGLNITLGLAGLLDLGFVAFFAVGAYTVGLLTTAGNLGLVDLPELALPTGLVVAVVAAIAALAIAPRLLRGRSMSRGARWATLFAAAAFVGIAGTVVFTAIAPLGGQFVFSSFWFAVPFAVLLAFLFGAFLGLPVLGIRGDYLAIATLGFGEIIALLARSNLLIPLLGGPQGVTLIPKPIEVPPTDPLAGPIQIYYLALAFAALIAFVAYRLRDSRIGRAWIAIREDEDVAEALGVNLVQTKLLAYMLGAAFAGLGGALFAAHIGAVFPTSINLFVSINVAALIIVGGMGSIPGVVLGAVFLIGLPELLRDVGGTEYRFLFYGIALILIMRFRPEGLVPSRVIERELHVEEANVEDDEAVVGARVAAREAGYDEGDYPPEPDLSDDGDALTKDPQSPAAEGDAWDNEAPTTRVEGQTHVRRPERT